MSGESAEDRRGPNGVAGKRGRGSRERRRGILRIRYKKIQTYVSKLRKQSRWKRRWMGFINTQDRSTCAFCANAPNEREHLSLYLSLSLTVFSLSHHSETDRFWTCSAIIAALNLQRIRMDYCLQNCNVYRVSLRSCQCLIADVSHDSALFPIAIASSVTLRYPQRISSGLCKFVLQGL